MNPVDEATVARLRSARRGAFAVELAAAVKAGFPMQAVVILLAARVDELERQVDALESAVAGG